MDGGMTVSFLKSVEPSSLELGGSTIPLYFSLRAAALMENKVGLDYPTLVNRLFQTPDADGEVPEPLSLTDQALVMACLIHEGQRATGQQPEEVEKLADTISRLHMSEVNALILAATEEILFKSSRGKNPKNG